MQHYLYGAGNRVSDNKYKRKIFSDRFNLALDEIGIPPMNHGRQTEVAKLFNVSQGSARKWVLGESYPEITKLSDMCRKLGVTMKWLVSGSGDMKDENQSANEMYIDETLLLEVIESTEKVINDVSNRSLSVVQRARLITQTYLDAYQNGKINLGNIEFAIKIVR